MKKKIFATFLIITGMPPLFAASQSLQASTKMSAEVRPVQTQNRNSEITSAAPLAQVKAGAPIRQAAGAPQGVERATGSRPLPAADAAAERQTNRTLNASEAEQVLEQYNEMLAMQREPLLSADEEVFLLNGQIWQRSYGEREFYLAPTIDDLQAYHERLTAPDAKREGKLSSRLTFSRIRLDELSRIALAEMGIRVPSYVVGSVLVLLPRIDGETLNVIGADLEVVPAYGTMTPENIAERATVTLWSETFEGSFPGTAYAAGDDNSTSGEDYWDDVSCDSYEGSRSLWSADIGTLNDCTTYDDDMDAYAYPLSGVFVGSYSSVQFSFAVKYDTEPNYDKLQRYYSSNGSSWTLSTEYTGNSGGWKRKIVNVNNFQNYFWKFSFHSDSSVNTYEGAFLDDMKITGESPSEPNLTLKSGTGNLSVSGMQVDVALTVENAGNTSSPSSYVGYFLSTDTSLSTSSDYLIGTDYVTSLAAGATSAESLSVDVGSQSVPPGTYYVFFKIDYQDAVTESNETDNVFYWPNQQVSISADPNLTLQSGTGSLAVAGTQLDLSLTVVNFGQASAPASYVGYYLSRDTTLSTSSDYLIGTDYVTGLAVGASSAESLSVDVSSQAVPPGTYYVMFKIDYQDAVAESDETDNTFLWSSPQVTISSQPNLTLQSGTGTLNVSGTQVDISLTVINSGQEASTPSYIGYYLSTDTNLSTSSDYLIGTDYVTSLSVGGTTAESLSVDVASQSVPSGTYYVIFKIDYQNGVAESDETDNTFLWSSPQVTISSQPNLTLQSGTGTLSVSGTQVNVTLTVVNTGLTTAPSSYVGYYLSADTSLSTSTDYLIGTDYVTSLASGGTSAESLSLDVVSQSIPLGSYYVFFKIDYQAVVTESDENDNVFYWPGTRVTISSDPNLTLKPGTGSLSVTGTQVNVSLTVTNTGGSTAPASYVGYYLSTDTSLSASSDYLIGTDYVSSLAAGSTSAESLSVDVAGQSVPAGSYYLMFMIDYLGAVSESAEDDNAWYFDSLTVTVPTAGQQPGSFTVSGTVQCDNPSTSQVLVDLAWTRSNNATSYLLLRSMSLLTELPSNGRSYRDYVSPATSYSYQVVAVNSYGQRDSNVLALSVPTNICNVVSDFQFSTISSPQAIGNPFSVTISARDLSGSLVDFDGTLQLSASLGQVNPAYVYMQNGSVSLSVTLDGAGSGIRLTAASGTKSGQSNVFDVTGGPPTGILAGRVQEGSGAWVAGARVILSTPSGDIQETTKNDGRYQFDEVPCGLLEIRAETDNGLTSDTQEIYVPCNSTVSHNLIFLDSDCDPTRVPPILMVPGIMGSATDARGFGNKYPLLPKTADAPAWNSSEWGNSGLSGLHGPSALGVGWNEIVDRFSDANPDYDVHCTLFPVPYDWRKTIDAIARDYLKPAIDHAKAVSGQAQVYVVAHSMGGLVTRSYIQGSNYENDIARFAMVGTPNQGAPLSYYIWEGGDPVLADEAAGGSDFYTKTSEFMFEAEYGYEPRDPKKNRIGFRIDMRGLYQTNVDSIRNLLPTWNFLGPDEGPDRGLSCLPSNQWQNIELERLNSSSTRSRMGKRNDASGKVRTVIFASKDKTTADKIETGKRDDYCLSGVSDGFYPDGTPTGWQTGSGDGTVPLRSARGGLATDSDSLGVKYVDFETADYGKHSGLVGQFESELCEFLVSDLSGSDCSSGFRLPLEAQTLLSVTLLGRSRMLLEDAGGNPAGVDPLSGDLIEGIPDAHLAMGADASSIFVPNPTVGTWTLRLSGSHQEDYRVVVSYQDSEIKKSIDAKGFFSNAYDLRFDVSTTGTPRLVMLSPLAAPEDLQADPIVGVSLGTRLTWAAHPDPSVIGYEVFSKKTTEPSLALLGSTSTSEYDSGHAWAANASVPVRVYTVAAVLADGSRTFLSRTVLNDDRDHDGLSDAQEQDLGTDASLPDSDGDGLNDGAEVLAGTDPTSTDTDGDGYTDGEEVTKGSDPRDAGSVPSLFTDGFESGNTSAWSRSVP